MRQQKSGIPTMGVNAGAKAGLDALTKILAKEVAPFNIRTLTVVLGTFNANMPNSVVLDKTPPPEDYKESFAEQIQDLLVSGKIKPNADTEKAMQFVYQVVDGEGIGEGHQMEKLLPLRRGVQEYLGHALEVFGWANEVMSSQVLFRWTNGHEDKTPFQGWNVG
ncbi:hypothetical protein N7457_008139 [Penicillium paradoxum]|uniref:uncharacterized protein n=1 Tax=Penicillium paradoxum TaxID=176176 RepID=UPI0025467DF5|nr:uncharacterized protein N7457_008139 [Penicillium paradoxum]KAJ5773243.1 hypothetical protein N7457_008139 [Penicillium paradoxum]